MEIHAGWLKKFCAIAVFLSIASAYAANRGDLEAALKAKYEITKTGMDRARITQPGTVLIIQKEGISGDVATDMTFLNNKVRNGQVAQAGADWFKANAK